MALEAHAWEPIIKKVTNDFGSAFGSIEKVVQTVDDDASDIGSQNNSNDWKQDVGMRSCCMYEYEWWRTIKNEISDYVPFFERL